MAKWYAAAVVSRVDEDGVRRWLVLDTRSTNPKFSGEPVQTKFCGGTEENHENEDKSILDTLRREFIEESHLVLREGAKMTVIQAVNLPGHFKNFYDIDFSDCVGSLRAVEKTIEGDWMSVPYWVTFKKGCKSLYGHHNSALQKSAERHKVKVAV